ncbi:unnamed protein product [Lymnaea stagnalis]|uniref:Uncharacterized protein n=1 Tax=Lymnaea stagnalis TaxID=6523 RepID=A0AAV2HPG0_LYMST
MATSEKKAMHVSIHRSKCSEEKGSAINQTDHQTPLSAKEIFMTATEHGDAETVVKMIEKLNVSPNLTAVREGLERNALSIAATYGQIDTVAELLKNGANPTLRSARQRTPLHDACIGGHFECAQLLMDAMSASDVNIPDNSGQTAAHIAAFQGETKILKQLIEKGADLSKADHKGRQTAHLAASRNQVNALRILFDSGIDLDHQCSAGKTLLHHAAEHGGLDTVKFLVERDCDLTLCDHSSNLAAHVAARHDNLNCLKFLVKQGTFIDTPQTNGKACSHIAAINGSVHALHWLLESGANVNLPDGDGNTPAHHAALGGRADCFNCCMHHHANLDAANGKGDTPMDAAKKSGHPLLMHKAATNEVMCPECCIKLEKEDYDYKHPLAPVVRSMSAAKQRAFRSPMTPKKRPQSQKRMVKSDWRISQVPRNDEKTFLTQRDIPAKYFGEYLDPNSTFKLKLK